MVNKELLEYINKRVSEGATKEIIITELITGGWAETDVNDAFAKRIESKNGIPQKDIQILYNLNYVSRSRKVFDFLVGFLGIIFFSFIALYVGDEFIPHDANNYLLYIPVCIFFVLYIILKFMKTSRRYISIGIISAVVGFLLIFGSCLFIIRDMCIGC